MRTEFSSSITFAYKFIAFPLWCLFALTAASIASIASRDWALALVANGFVLFMILIGWLMIRNLRQVSYDDQFLYVKNFSEEIKFDLRKVRTINGANLLGLDPFFEIEFYPEKGSILKVDFLPPISEHIEYSLYKRLSGKVLAFKQKIREISIR